jgi:hypothetical protein
MNGIKCLLWRHLVGFFLIFTIYGCGGGGSSQSATTPIEEQPSTTLAITKEIVAQAYSGKIEAAVVDEFNIKSIGNEILYWKDFLRLLVNGTDNPNSLEHPDNIALSISAQPDKTCQSGTVDEPVLDDVNKLKPLYVITYSNCRIGNLIANGEVRWKIVGSDITAGKIDYFAIEIDDNFSLFDIKLNKTYVVLGLLKQAFESSIFNVQLEVSSGKVSQLLISDGSIDSFSRIQRGRMYLAEYGYFDLNGSDIYQGENWISIKEERVNNHMDPVTYYVDLKYEPIDGVDRYGISKGKIIPWFVNNIQIEYENFSTLNFELDLGETKAEFLGENIIYEGDSIDLAVFDSQSPDSNFVTVFWQIQNNDQAVIFESDEITQEYLFTQAGIYNLTLFVKDSYGNESHYSEKIHVLLKDYSLVLENDISVISELSAQTVYQAQINTTGESTNYSMSIAYGPEGLSVENGLVSWDGLSSNHFLASQINYGIRVTDDDSGKAIIIEASIDIAPDNITVERYNHLRASEVSNFDKNQIKALNPNNGLFVLSFSDSALYRTVTLVDGLLKIDEQKLPLPQGYSLSDIKYSNELQGFDFLIREGVGNINEPFYRFSELDKSIGISTISGSRKYLLPLKGNDELELFEAVSTQISTCDFFPGGKKEVITTTPDSNFENGTLHYWEEGIKKQLTLPSGQVYYKAFEFIDSDNDEVCDYILGYSNYYADNEYHVAIEQFQWRNNALDKSAPDFLIKSYYQASSRWPQVVHPETGKNGILFIEVDDNELKQWAYIGVNNLGDFTSNKVTANANLGIQLSPGFSRIIANVDLDNDNINEWVFYHRITENDPMFEQIGYRNEHDSQYYILVAAKLEANKLTPIYVSGVSIENISIHKTTSILSAFSNGDIVLDNGKRPFVMEADTRFKKGFGDRELLENQTYYVFEDGGYYQIQGSFLSFVDFDGNALWKLDISEHIINDNEMKITVHDTYNDDVDFITLNDHWFVINREEGVFLGEYGDNLDSFSLHPNFSENGLVFLYPENYHFIEHAHGEHGSILSTDISGVYMVDDKSFALKYNWREKVFSKVSVRVDSFNWIDVDNDGEMEIVAYFTKQPNDNGYEDIHYYYYSKMEGGEITIVNMLIEGERAEYTFDSAREDNNRCYERSCRIVLRTDREGSMLAIDKLTGKELWKFSYFLNLSNPWIAENGDVSFSTPDSKLLFH